MTSPEEFEGLPPSVQKQCFSPVERLRLGQQYHEQKRKKQPSKGSWLAPPSPSAEIIQRPATSLGITTKQKSITVEQARWFLTLPDKIRRQQFTREEQITLVVRCKKVLEHASPELAKDAYRRCWSEQKRQPRPSVEPDTEERPSASVATSLDESRSFLDLDTSSIATTDTSNAEMKIFKLYSRFSQATSVTDLALDDIPPPPPVSVPPPPPSPPPKKRLLRRRFSLTPLPLPPPTLAPPVPSLPPLDANMAVRPLSMSSRLSRPYMDLFTSVPAPLPEPQPEYAAEFKSYHDEDIRKQLRKSLISPESFDKVIEFGYVAEEVPPLPSATTEYFPFHHPPSSSGESDCGGDETSTEATGPRTPTPTSGPLLTAVKQTSFDFGVNMPLKFASDTGLATTHSPAHSISNREVTVHMTLTRPDLRTPEERLYSVQRQQTSGVDVEKQDPLALQVLPVCDDPTGAHGAFAVQSENSKGFKRVWKTLRGQ